ncbi:MAG: MATE family efflux transporter [Ruminococcaceae bacterium]|nr:MATE family efflux transporter [Oscillospiraceae bacterium]
MARQKVNFTEGSLFDKIFFFTIPLMLSGILQLIYNMADRIVIGRYAGDPNALAAVGCTGSINNLIVNFLIGVSVGCSAIIAQYYGAKKKHELSRTVHTSITFALIGGIIMAVIAFICVRSLLELIDTKPDIIDQAELYIKIIILGVPGSAVFNFGATILRAIGDSKTPLIILATTGFANVVLNILFVVCFKMNVEGVALATIISQYMSAVAVIWTLYKSNEDYQFRFKKMCIDAQIFKRIISIGFPSGLQSTLFSISNVVCQGAINTFPTEVVSGNTIASTVDGLTYTAMHSFQQSAITFAGQNYGAGKYKRVKRSLIYSMIQVSVVGLIVSWTEILFANQLASLFVDKTAENAPQIIAAAVEISRLILCVYFLCGVMEVLSGYLRGLGYSFSTMVCSLLGACVCRILWFEFIFPLPAFNSIFGLYISYPITWSLTALLLALICIKPCKAMKKAEMLSDTTK